MTSDDFPDVPGPQQNAIEEAIQIKVQSACCILKQFIYKAILYVYIHFLFQVELSEEEKKDLEYDLDDLEMLTDGEEEHDTPTFTETLQQLGLLGQLHPNKFEPDDIESVKALLHGLTLAQKGHEMLAKGCHEIKQVIARVPSIHKLQGLLEVIKSTDPSLVEAARVASELPQTGKLSKSTMYKPKRVDSKFVCRICGIQKGSWVGCDSHIRDRHSNIAYGPCRTCKKFTTTAYDTFKRHQKKCAENASS